MTWYRIYKTYRNGQFEFDYFQVPKYSKKDYIEEIAIEWAEDAEGGENYGWRVYWKRIKKPPKKWLKDEIKRMELRIISRYESIEYLTNKIESTKKLI